MKEVFSDKKRQFFAEIIVQIARVLKLSDVKLQGAGRNLG